MNEAELRTAVEQLVRQYTAAQPQLKEIVRPGPELKLEEALDDLAAIDLREQYLVKDPVNGPAFLELKRKTPARLGVGRAGARYKTVTMLRMRADHAAAVDSVFSHVNEELPKKEGWTMVKTLCRDKDEYLTRPDLGRRFGEEEQKTIRDTLGKGVKVAIVVGDGISSAAIEANAAPCVNKIKKGLAEAGISCGPVLFVKYCRVGASDHIGELTNADVVCMLVGERPGLVTAESMSLYITYGAHIGIPESRRTVISNVHAQGTPPVEAGARAVETIKRMLEQKTSGVLLK